MARVLRLGVNEGPRGSRCRYEFCSLSRSSFSRRGETALVLTDQWHLPLPVLVPPLCMPAFETGMASMHRNLAGAMEEKPGRKGAQDASCVPGTKECSTPLYQVSPGYPCLNQHP